MSGNYKVKIKDIQNKYKFKIFCASNYDDSEIKKMYEAIYMALPKEKASGTSITLNDTAKSFMMNELYATDTTQPTTNGYNLLDLSSFNTQIVDDVKITKNADGSLTLNGTLSSAQKFVILGSISFTSGTSYTISGLTNGSENTYQLWTQSSTAFPSGNRLNCTTAPNTKTAQANETCDIRLYLYNNVSLNNVTIYPMIEVGTTAHDFEIYTGGIPAPNPSYPMPIHTITGNNNIRVWGKNLLDLSTLQQGIYQPSASPQLDNTSDARYRAFALSLKAGTYTINFDKSCFIVRDFTSYDYSGNTTLGNFSGNAITSATFTMTQNGIAYFGFRKDSGNWDNNNDLAWLTSGNEATPYQPYQNNAVLLTLGDTEICKIGNYEDKIFKAIKGNEIYDSLTTEEQATLDYGSWYLREIIAKVLFNGTEDWGRGSLGEGRYQFYLSGYSFIPYSGQMTKSNYFLQSYDNNVDNGVYVNSGGNMIVFVGVKVNNSYITTKDDWKTWLSNNNVKVYSILATPTNIKFNDTIQDQLEDIYNNMISYEGQTNISQINNDLPFNINSSALKDLSEL